MTHLFNPMNAGKPLSGIGGKGLRLQQLDSTCSVPDWFAIPAGCFSEILHKAGADTRIREILRGLNPDNSEIVSAEIQKLIGNLTLPDSLISEIEALLQKVAGANGNVAVRSSAADEDGSLHSFAGIHDSFLHINSLPSVCKHIRKVWSSGYNARALLYRCQNNLPVHPVSMGVIVQRMICAKASGIIFTADPATQDPFQIVISALYGLGAGVASAGLESDLYRFDKRTCQSSITVAAKSRKIEMNHSFGCGVHEYPVEDELQLTAVLSSRLLEELVAAALKIEHLFSRPQDIEFCFDENDKLFILQTREITTVKEYGPAAGNYQIWDNSTIIESYSGVTSPMTFSFIRHAYAEGYRTLSKVMGMSERRIKANDDIYQNMLGVFHGRVYSNLPSWHRLVKQFSGHHYSQSVMDSMQRFEDKAGGADAVQKGGSVLCRSFMRVPENFMAGWRMAVLFSSLSIRISRFNRRFERFLAKWNADGFSQMQPHELMHVYREIEKYLLQRWKTPIINDLHVMIFGDILKKYCRKWCGDDDGILQNRLICGEGGMASSGPTRMLMQLALKIKSVDGIKYFFQTHTPEELASLVPAHPDCREIAGSISRYLQLYGFRCANELKLEEPSLHETPEFIYQMLQNYIGMSDRRLDVNAMIMRERVIRVEAEQMAFKKLSGGQRIRFRLVLTQLRKGMRNREKMRFARTRICGLIRQLLNAAGAIMARENVIDNDQDIYYLTMDEVWDYIKGTAVTTNLRSLIEIRHNEYDLYCNEPDEISDHFRTYGMAYNRNAFHNQEIAGCGMAGNGSMQGVSCSPGRAQGKARVVRSPRDDMRLNRQILVASRADPGWLLLYPALSAILIEHGSILSHAAIVAREMGIPAIIGIPGLLAAVSDGVQLVVDATAGTVNFA